MNWGMHNRTRLGFSAAAQTWIEHNQQYNEWQPFYYNGFHDGIISVNNAKRGLLIVLAPC